jgi:hypothetical protein
MTLNVLFQLLGVGGGREKSHFFVDPTWTSPNKHLLGGIVFWVGYVGDSPRGPLKQLGNPHLKPATSQRQTRLA